MSERPNTPIAHIFRMNVGEPLEEVREKCERFLNQTVHSTTGYAPAEIVGVRNEVCLNNDKRTIDLEGVRSKIIAKAERNNLRGNDPRRTEVKIERGDYVFVRNFGREKMEDFWLGPFLVMEVSEKGNSFLISEENSEVWENVKHVKLYMKENESVF